MEKVEEQKIEESSGFTKFSHPFHFCTLYCVVDLNRF